MAGCDRGAGVAQDVAAHEADIRQVGRHRGTDGLHDSPLEEVSSELGSEAGVAAEEFLESIKKGSKPSAPWHFNLESRYIYMSFMSLSETM